MLMFRLLFADAAILHFTFDTMPRLMLLLPFDTDAERTMPPSYAIFRCRYFHMPDDMFAMPADTLLPLA